MPWLSVHRLSMAHPGDVSALAALFDSGALAPAAVRAVIGKTEGNGGLNDFTRGFFTQSLMLLLSRATGTPETTLAGRIPCVLSGGTEGVLSPHFSVFAVTPEAASGEGLALGTAFGPATPPEAIGNDGQIAEVAAAVRAAMQDAGIADAGNVRFVQVKVPAGGPGKMARSRAAAALGAAQALGDLPRAPRADDLLIDLSLYSSRVSVSAGVEVVGAEVVVLGTAPGWADELRIAVRPMADALDLAAVLAVFRDLGLAPDPAVPESLRRRVAAVLVKGEPDVSGCIRGQRHTMLGDTDIDAQRHLRGAIGGLVAAVAGDGRIFVSGGAEHQGPPGGGLIAVIASQPD